MAWPEYYGPLPYPYPTGYGQTLGLVACIFYTLQLVGTTIYIFHKHTHRHTTRHYSFLHSLPPVANALFRAWAGGLLGLLSLRQDWLTWNLAMVVQPHLFIVFGLVEWMARHTMDGQLQLGATVSFLLLISAMEVGFLYISDELPIFFLVLAAPTLVTALLAVRGLWEGVRRKDGAGRIDVGLMVLGLVGGVSAIVSVLYSPWMYAAFGYAQLAAYSVDTLLTLCALAAAAYSKSHARPAAMGGYGLDMGIIR